MKLPFFLASRFVAGETLDESLPVVDELNEDGLHVALDKLGEHVHDRETPSRRATPTSTSSAPSRRATAPRSCAIASPSSSR
jgi:hypothetical protein